MVENWTEVVVLDVVHDKQRRTVVVAVPNNRSLRVGEKFVSCYINTQTIDDILNERPRQPPVDIVEVALTVVAIDTMRTLVDELPRGVTGGLYLSGEGLDRVTSNCYLRTEPI